MQRTHRKRRNTDDHSHLYSQDTEPALFTMTAPLPANYRLPGETWLQRFLQGIGHFIAAIIHKCNQILGLALAVLLLLLFTRVLLVFFALKTSLFAQWVFLLSDPLVMPFNNFLPVLPYEGFLIDTSTLVAIIVYFLLTTVVRQFLRLLAGR
jgi:uncharacterized protein YggT (Ycf19 family)